MHASLEDNISNYCKATMFLILILATLTFANVNGQCWNGTGGWDPSLCCYPVPPVCCEPTGCPPCMDVAFALDASGSIGNRWLSAIIPFLSMFAMTTEWTVGTGPNDYQFGAVTFHNSVTFNWDWAGVQTASTLNLLTGFTTLPHFGQFQLTSTALGLKTMREQIVQGPNNRPQCPDICIIVTDGIQTLHHGLNLTEETILTNMACDKVIAVGITGDIPLGDLQQLASQLNYSFHTLDVEGLPGLFYDVLDVMCPRQMDCCPYRNPLLYV